MNLQVFKLRQKFDTSRLHDPVAVLRDELRGLDG
jgi:hypothetical protein